MQKKHHIAIVGAGGIGRAVGLILAESEQLHTQIYIGDLYEETANDAVQWIEEGCELIGAAIPFVMSKDGANDEMRKIFHDCDIVLDCLPGSQAPRIAGMAKEYNMHYANLTEYVKETNDIIEIAKGANQGFVLQTGLAPGFINILGNQLYQQFCSEYQVEKVKEVSMKVGALTRHAEAPHFYGFTWSPIGVATEYLKDCIVVRNGKKRLLPALSERATIIIDGITYEDNLTSGGAADLPDYLEGKVENLDYKTLRYPGHYQWVANTVAKIPDSEDRARKLQEVMQENIPSVEDDIVIVYASVKGHDHKGVLRAIEASYSIEPVYIGKKKLKAIQATTAAPLCEVARMLLTGSWSGAIFQSQIDTKEFMNGPFVSRVYKQSADVLPITDIEKKFALR